MTRKKYDVAVIGAGPGGYVAAVHAAKLGFKTVCIDKRNEPGGTCLNVGCIPSKSLLYVSELYEHVQKQGSVYGIVAKGLNYDFEKMMSYKRDVVSGLVQGVTGLFKSNKVDYINETATFLDSKTIKVGSEEIEADNFILATGSEPITLPFLPIDENRIVTSTGALSLKKVPKRLVVIGAGVIGVELASVYRRLGSEVTMIEMLDRICPTMDSEVSKSLLKILKKQGLEFFLSTQVQGAKIGKEAISLTLKGGEKDQITADVVLVSIGRKPFSEGLGLNTIGVEVNKRGFVEVDGCLRTRLQHVYAIGDLIDGPMLAHKASEEGVAVVELIAGRRQSINYMAIPNVIYTSPEAASVGLTEQEAKELGLEVKIALAYFKANARSHCTDETDGFVKLVGDLRTNRLVGMHILGPQASELIAEGMIGIEKGVSVQDLAKAPNAHPTYSETIKEAAMKF